MLRACVACSLDIPLWKSNGGRMFLELIFKAKKKKKKKKAVLPASSIYLPLLIFLASFKLWNHLKDDIEIHTLHTTGFCFIWSFLFFIWLVTELLCFVHWSLALSEPPPLATHKGNHSGFGLQLKRTENFQYCLRSKDVVCHWTLPGHLSPLSCHCQTLQLLPLYPEMSFLGPPSLLEKALALQKLIDIPY